jgi:hypothetical protein
MMTRETIISIASTTMVNLGEDGKPKAHKRKLNLWKAIAKSKTD